MSALPGGPPTAVRLTLAGRRGPMRADGDPGRSVGDPGRADGDPGRSVGDPDRSVGDPPVAGASPASRRPLVPGGPGDEAAGVLADERPAPAADAAPTRERLLRAAREVVESGGYGGASVAAIALRAGVANGTLYRHFGSKAELFVEVFRAVCGREVAAMEDAVAAAGDDHVARVLAPLDVFSRRALQNRALAWALLAEPVDPLVDEVRLEYRRTYRELLAAVLAEAVAAGALPPQDPDLTAAALVGAVGEALVGPVSAAAARTPAPADGRSPARAPAAPGTPGPRAPGDRPEAVGAPGVHDGAPSPEPGPSGDERLLRDLAAVCRRATGAASRVRADASGEPR